MSENIVDVPNLTAAFVRNTLKEAADWCARRYDGETAGRVGAALLERLKAEEVRPHVVCLCGSTRFYQQFQEANYRLTMEGNIVLTVGHYPHSPGQAHGESVGCTPEQKVKLDELHTRKIDLADSVLVLNVGGYIGESTRNEINYATLIGKPVEYLEPISEEQS